MNRNWTIAAVWVALTAVTLVGVGCSKKQPEAPEVTPPPAPMETKPVTEIEEPPKPPVDTTPSPLDMEIEALNAWALEQGLIGDVYFDFDKYDLRPEARDRLAKNAAFMREYPTVTVRIEGHCDERGTNEYNIALGDRRASAAADYTSSLGISDSRLRTVSYGEESPNCSVSSEACWSRNRRARFVITGK